MKAVDHGVALKQAIFSVIDFLKQEKTAYLILGGVAVGMIGEPRLTADFDLDIFLSRTKVTGFLVKAKSYGFRVDEREAKERADQFGTFRIFSGDIPIDFILASTTLEKEAYHRSQKMVLFGKEMSFPTPEDLILLKLIPGRPKDLIDVESIVLRHWKKLDLAYLRKWTQKICDEAEDFRVKRTLEKLLKLKA
jgi:hypothetical protein